MKNLPLFFACTLLSTLLACNVSLALSPRPTPPEATNTSAKTPSSAASTSTEKVSASQTSSPALKTYMETFKKDLVDSQGKAWDGAKLEKVEYLAIYYSAHWCPPCRRFSPKLVEFYEKMKPKHANFEVVFVSSDRSEKDQLGYMKELKMPWPALAFNKIQDKHPLLKHQGDGIPHLVFLDANGKVLSSSVENGEYVGPYKVVEDIRKTLEASSSSAVSTPAAASTTVTSKPKKP